MRTAAITMRTLNCLIIAAMVPTTAALRPSASGLATRRSAVANIFGAAAVVTLPTLPARAACFGKCEDAEEAERKQAERLAIQTGSRAVAKQEERQFSSGVEGLIERSIYNAEQENGGQPLSEQRKAQIAAKVKALSPVEGNTRKKKVKARYGTGEE